MSQQRITLFFPLTTRRKKRRLDRACRLLDLPAAIRLQIYHEAGLPSRALLDLNDWATLRKQSHGDDNDYEVGDDLHGLPLSLPIALSSTCRFIHDEVEALLYGDNSFVVSRAARGGLRSLQRLSGRALQTMTSLLVRLNISSSSEQEHHPFRPICGNGQYRQCPSVDIECDQPLNLIRQLESDYQHDSHHQLLTQWTEICSRLVRHTVPGRLVLHLICDCQNVGTATMITEPMLSLPILRNLSLRLGSYPTRGLQNLAIEVADRLLEPPASSTPDSPFQFSDLPKELQITVLRQTPLVTGTDVWVNRGRLHYPGFCKTSGNVALDCDVDGDKTYLLQCFCQRSHSAFNRNCDCNSARFPSSLFQVSRQIRDLASTVFYGGNLFHVIMTDDSKIARKDLISSLEWFPEGALKYLTSLILDFKGFQAVPTFADTHNRRTWEDIISLLSTQARLPALNLELHIKEFYFDDSFNHSLRASPDYEQRMRSTYIEMFEVAKGLRGLKNLFVHLDWNTSTCEDDGRRELEGLLERMVMGEQYDAWEYGKTTRFRSSYEAMYGCD